jgi:hypothetical protein
VKDGAEWRFDTAAGWREMRLRQIGHDEGAVVQTLLAIVDAQRDYANLDPMKTGSPVYARRLLSLPGRKDGLFWETKPGEPPSPWGRPSPRPRSMVPRRTAIMATTSACSILRVRRRRAGRMITS